MKSNTQSFHGSAVCLFCRGVIPSTKENSYKLQQHLLEEHNTFFYKDLVLKLHFMDKSLLDAILEFPNEKTKSVAESVKVLNKIMNDNKFVEENDSFTISVDASKIKNLAVNENVYDDIEGSSRFYKEKDESADYTALENSHNRSIDDFIKTLPHDISYNSEFEPSLSENLEETDYIMDRINQMDHSAVDDDLLPNLEEEESTKKKFKTQRVSCEVCLKTLSKGSMKNHMRLVHSGAKNYECEVCGEKFESKMEVVRHKAKQHPKDRRSRLGRVLSNNSYHDDSSQEGTADGSIVDENFHEAPGNLLNVTIPNETMEEMVDHIAEDGVSV